MRPSLSENNTGVISAKTATNALWMILQKVVVLGGGFLVLSATARYLGPERYGLLAYASSVFSLLAIAGHLGLGHVAIRELVRFPEKHSETLGTVVCLKVLGFSLGGSLMSLLALYHRDADRDLFLILIALSCALLFKCTEIFDFWFQATVKSVWSARSSILAFFVGAASTCYGIYVEHDVTWFVTYPIILVVVSGIGLTCAYVKFGDGPSLFEWRFKKARFLEIAPLAVLSAIGTFFSVVSLKIDQVMLKNMMGNEAVGIYAVAAQISEVGVFIPSALVASMFPALIMLRETKKDFDEQFQQVLSALFVMGLVMICGIFIFGSTVIGLFFGSEYSDSVNVLYVHSFGAVFVYLRLAFSRWIVIEEALIFSVVTQMVGALLNIFLNYLVIPAYGVLGAAAVTVISYSVSGYWALLLSYRTRPVFWQMTHAMVSPLQGARYLRHWLSVLVRKRLSHSTETQR